MTRAAALPWGDGCCPPWGLSFRSVAARARISRTTLYRRADLRAVIDEHRAQGQDATTLTGLAVQIDQLRRSLEAVAAKVRRHDVGQQSGQLRLMAGAHPCAGGLPLGHGAHDLGQ